MTECDHRWAKRGAAWAVCEKCDMDCDPGDFACELVRLSERLREAEAEARGAARQREEDVRWLRLARRWQRLPLGMEQTEEREEAVLDTELVQAIVDYVNANKGTVTIEPGGRITLAGKGVDGVLFQRIIEGLK